MMGDFENDRVISPEQYGDDTDQEYSLRPTTLDEFIGQDKLKNSLLIYLEAAKKRNEPLDHVLLSGPPGLGKTTLAHIISNSMDSKLSVSSGPTLEKPSELASLLTNLGGKDVFFIDEIHRLKSIVEEYLYPAMEDYKIDIILGSGPSAESIRLDLKKFTLVGATTRSGMLTSPLRDRFGLSFRLNPYTKKDLQQILTRSANILGTEYTPEGISSISGRCRGTPRVANRILRRCRDVAQVRGKGIIDEAIALKTLDMLGIDSLGLDEMDRKILNTIMQKFDGQPVGLTTLGAAVGEEIETLEEVYEPYLIQCGLLKRTPRGRVATRSAYTHLGFPIPDNATKDNQGNLFK
ncbi:MAG: Holliday junction branch migration DNA helicase RuvB [Fibrobacteria bacterium]|nr:Holliday junction branch migration DNA helicase RuvB [Fibrobacteria bacterium]